MSTNLIETDRGKEFLNKKFAHFLNKKHIKSYSRNTCLGAVFAESYNRIGRYLLKRPVFQSGNGNWVMYYPQYRNIVKIEFILLPN